MMPLVRPRLIDCKLAPHMVGVGWIACFPGTKTGTRVRSHVRPERKPERGSRSPKPPFWETALLSPSEPRLTNPAALALGQIEFPQVLLCGKPPPPIDKPGRLPCLCKIEFSWGPPGEKKIWGQNCFEERGFQQVPCYCRQEFKGTKQIGQTGFCEVLRLPSSFFENQAVLQGVPFMGVQVVR